jgi:hypothetical protein
VGLFRHPDLTRGIVHTSKDSFASDRGIVDVSDDLGESYGWLRVTSGDQESGNECIATDLSGARNMRAPGLSDACYPNQEACSMLSLPLPACDWVRNLSLARIVAVIMGVTITAVLLEARP